MLINCIILYWLLCENIGLTYIHNLHLPMPNSWIPHTFSYWSFPSRRMTKSEKACSFLGIDQYLTFSVLWKDWGIKLYIWVSRHIRYETWKLSNVRYIPFKHLEWYFEYWSCVKLFSLSKACDGWWNAGNDCGVP